MSLVLVLGFLGFFSGVGGDSLAASCFAFCAAASRLRRLNPVRLTRSPPYAPPSSPLTASPAPILNLKATTRTALGS